MRKAWAEFLLGFGISISIGGVLFMFISIFTNIKTFFASQIFSLFGLIFLAISVLLNLKEEEENCFDSYY